jgi:hypothetical protein
MRSIKAILTCAAGLSIAALSAIHAQTPPAAPSSSAAPAPPAATAPATQPRGPDVITMALRPMATTQPALAHKLLPDLADQTPGNAVTLYLMARRFWPDQKTTNEILYPENERYDYLGTPIDEFPQKYAERLLAGYAETLKFVDLGARRRDAEWDAGWRETGFADGKWTSYLNDLRHAMNLLGFRARYQLSRGDFAGAEYTLQTGFSAAQQLGTEPLLIHGLVQLGFTELMLSRGVDEWISRPNAPNLYWPLTNLPPLMDLRAVAREEQFATRIWKPRLDRAIRGELPAEQWPQFVRESVADLIERRPPYKPDPARAEAEAKRLVEATVARARQAFIAGGMPREQVEAMSPEQAAGTYWVREYRRTADEMWKVWPLSYPQGQEQVMRFWRELGPDRPPVSENPLIQTYLVASDGADPPNFREPSLWRGRYQFARTERRIALLRAIEAVRDYAGRHDGRPPERLEQITELPVPTDPMTGKPFPFHFDGKTVVVEAPAPPGRSPTGGYRYELTVGRK